jgi:hypothetical protein
MASWTSLKHRARFVPLAFGVPLSLLSLVLSLVVGMRPALAATTLISTDPFTQAMCAASGTTNHHTEVEPESYSFGSTKFHLQAL